MPKGYLVSLGDGVLDSGDAIGGGWSSFTTDKVIGSGGWTWSGTVGKTTYSNEWEPGEYVLASNGNVYFVPEYGKVDNLQSAKAVNPPSYPSDGEVHGTNQNDDIDENYVDEDGDSVDDGGGGNNNDVIDAKGGDDTVDAGSGHDEVRGGGGDDVIHGGSGNDTIYGDTGDSPDATVEITAQNYSETGNGFTLTAQNVQGGQLTEASSDNVGVFKGTFGANGTVSDSDSNVAAQIGYDKASGLSENITVNFDHSVENASFSFNHLYTSNYGEVGHWAVYDGETLVAEGDFTEQGAGSGSGTIDLSGHGSFDKLVLTAKIQTDGTDGSDYTVSDITFENTDPDQDAAGGNDTIYGEGGSDTIYGEGGDDQIDGGGGRDTIYGGSGDDTITGGGGHDTIDGGSGDDTIEGGRGRDTLKGGDGDDTLRVSQNDHASGGSGDDTFIIVDHDENGGGPITIIGGDDGQPGGDTLDFNGLLKPGSLSMSQGDDGAYSGKAVLTDGSEVSFSGIENVVCFTKGTRIATPNGPVAIEKLQVGDPVLTRDNGVQMVRWAGSRTVPAAGRFAPITIGRGVLGNRRPITVSPQHRMLSISPTNSLLFGAREVFVPARHLVNGTTVRRKAGGMVTYVHLMFDRHQLVFAEDCLSESFYPGDQALAALEGPQRAELFSLFPELRSWTGALGPLARPCLRGREAALITAAYAP